MITYDITSASFNIDDVVSGDILNVPYTGSEISVLLPPGTYTFTAIGATGQLGYRTSSTAPSGQYTYVGGGGTTIGTWTITEDTRIYINVGGLGASAANSSVVNTGGYNGGGSTTYYGGTGGGATHVATVSGLLSTLSDQTSSILLVAGGGGGSTYYSTGYYGIGGAGGGTSGGDGNSNGNTNATYAGQGGTQSAGGDAGTNTSSRHGDDGSFGQGGNNTNSSSSYACSAGGGGYYGGGASSYQEAGGGGGSGYISSVLTDASTTQGVSTSATTANGSLSITAVSVERAYNIDLNLSGGTFTDSHSNGIYQIDRNIAGDSITFSPISSSQDVNAYINNIDVSNTLTENNGEYTLTFSNIEDDIVIRIICGDISDNFTVSVSAEHATVNPSERMVYKGSNLTITFTPTDISLYRYVGVYDNNTDVTSSVINNNGTYSYTLSNIQEIHQIIILSEEIPYHEVRVACGPMGSVTNLGVNRILDGQSLTINCTPDTNYETYKIYVNSEPVTFSENSYTLSNVQADSNIYVLFSSGDINFYWKTNQLTDWVQVAQAYKKINGRWEEQDFETLGDPNTKYVKANNITIQRVDTTARLIPSTYELSNTSLSLSDIDNAYNNTDNATYATCSTTSTSSRYLYLRGFNFDAIPNNAIIDSFSIKYKANESGMSTSSSYRPYIVNNTTTLTGTGTAINTTVTTSTFSGITTSYDVIKSYGSNFGIRFTVRRSGGGGGSSSSTGYLYLYGAEIEVNYHYYEVY